MLVELIKTKIKEKGPIPFSEFMQDALYTPNLGYYNSNLPKFGLHGDFTTAPELTSLFGYTLANQCLEVLKAIEKPCVFEFGAGTGKLCADILSHLEAHNVLPETYYILEVSAHLKLRQQEHIEAKIPHLAHKVTWLTQWPDNSFSGVMIANEVLDAMPVTRFCKTEETILEGFVSIDAQGKLAEVFLPSQNAQLLQQVKDIEFLTIPYQSEVNLLLDAWIAQCYKILKEGMFFILDYGFQKEEYYHPDRYMGTLMCHYQHQAHTNPFIHIGHQDITAHVDFSHVAKAAKDVGFQIAGYNNQASFLLNNGLLSLLEQIPPENYPLEAQAIKKLLQPHEMGELFKVIALSK